MNSPSSTYTVILTPGGRGYVAVCPVLDGCRREGETVGEAIDSVRDAMAGVLAGRRAQGLADPPNHGYIVGEAIEDALRQRADAGLDISIAAHEVSVG